MANKRKKRPAGLPATQPLGSLTVRVRSAHWPVTDQLQGHKATSNQETVCPWQCP